MSMPDPLQEAFEIAKDEFLAGLKGPGPYDFSGCVTIDAVYDETERIQVEQGNSGTLRNLKRIEPYLNCLNQYVGFMDTMGPLKLLLQISSSLVQSFDKVVEILAEIGHCLPHFGKYTEIFKGNQQMKGILSLFYGDILDFYSTTLNFFHKSKWKKFFESLWPKTLGKLNVIKNNIITHKSLMNSEVTFESIIRADKDRKTSKDMYESIQEHQDWQSFEAARSGIDPYFYEGDLERLVNESPLEAGRWLEDDASFKKWSDMNNNSARMFWLQGIPGAGKTITSTFAIRRKKEQGDNVLFAILSYNRQARDTALKILHSLIFQLLLSNPDLQPVMVEVYKFQFPKLSSTEFVARILSDLVMNSGHIYIILDGIDEISLTERRIVLSALVKTSEECENLRLLISSREERDIASIIGKGVLSIRVDRNNLSDIELYVSHEIVQWREALSQCGLDDRECSDLSARLKPVASKAEGMFLFAKLVIRNVKTQLTMADMIEEVNDLPNGIEEAYHRIISRIKDQLPPCKQDIARHTLEWIGCAMSPLTKEEILQALAITPGEKNFAKGRKVIADILDLCGPIIEIENGMVRFVHFTAKEFLFSTRNGKFLEKPRAHLLIGSVCLSYLSFDCFDEEIYVKDLTSLTSHILAGDYVLLTYASTEWLRHVHSCAPSLTTDSVQILQEQMKYFMSARENYFYQELEDTKSATAEFIRFKDHSNTQDFLANMWTFLSKKNFLGKSDEKDWVDYDPSSISTTVRRVRTQIEAMLCPTRRHRSGCHCLKLQDLYGYGLFKCNRFGCPSNCDGFDSSAARDAHLRTHSRPFKCPKAACSFAELGFLSNGDLTQHMGKAHVEQSTSQLQHDPARDQYSFSNLQDLDEIAEDLVRNNETTNVQEILGLLPIETLQKLLEISTEVEGPTMLNLLLDYAVYTHHIHRDSTREYLLLCAVRTKNVAVVEDLLDSGTDPYCKPKNWKGIQQENLRWKVFDSKYAQLDIMEAFLSRRRKTEDEISLWYFWDWLPRRYVANDESSAIEALARLARYFSLDDMGGGLYFTCARSSCLFLAEFFLEKGADANWKYNLRSPLEVTVSNYRKSGPEFARLLLQHGADPYPKRKRSKELTKVAGMAKLETQLGMTWDEFVRQVREETFGSTEAL